MVAEVIHLANYYISDLHIGHENIIRFDNRPFADINEMHRAVMDRWNSVVTGNDTVYILGDFIWAKQSLWPFLVEPLAGQKVLIRGNHDPKQFTSEVRRLFQDVQSYKEIDDKDGENTRHLILSHYPMPFHHYAFLDDCWMLYGHVHETREYQLLRQLRKTIKYSCSERGHARGNFVNVGCMMPWMDYTPRTLNQIIAGDQAAADWMFSESALSASTDQTAP